LINIKEHLSPAGKINIVRCPFNPHQYCKGRMMNAPTPHTITALDLEPIKVKLMHQESGEGWTLQRANAVEFKYRRFLHLMKMFPHEQTAPLVDVDTFWHYHILDTVKYAADCDAVFGYFLHHFPYIGLRGEDDEAAHVRVGLRMKALYEGTFGEQYLRVAANDIAHSGVVAEPTAHSGVVSGEIAHSVVVSGSYAHSGVVNVTAVQAGTASVAAQQSGFYTARPRLALSA
jgi:hypothetical protein